jgi:hypothetical protein
VKLPWQKKQADPVDIDVTEHVVKLARGEQVINPVTGDPLPKDKAEYVLQCRQARANARREMRSGNPAKRAAAAVVYRTAPRIIRAVYTQEARR